MAESAGHVTVAPHTLLAIVRAALRAVPGVVGLAPVPPAATQAMSAVGPGAAIRVAADGVVADCYIVAAADTRLASVGLAAQVSVAAALRELGGVPVRVVDVTIEDVAAPAPRAAGEVASHA